MIDLQTPLLGPVDLTPAQITGAIQAHPAPRPPAYDAPTLQEFAGQAVAVTRLFGLRASIVVGQMLHETGFLRFGGLVRPDQFNFGGLGATGAGVTGARFASVREGISAVCAHHLAYLLGAPANWPEPVRAFAAVDPRNELVVAGPHAGAVRVLGDYTNGRWAFTSSVPIGSLANGYAAAVARAANTLLGQEARRGAGRIALAAGHHNAQGGNPTEIEQTGRLTPAIARACRAMGLDVRVFTPDDGAGMSHLDLDEVAAQVVTAARDGWVADVFMEVHSEAGPPGVFCIYPDWPPQRDIDVDVRDHFGLAISQRIATATGLTVRHTGDGLGIMSERSTAVGSTGSRLGIFRATREIKATTTRLILECGSHTHPGDLMVMAEPGFASQAAQAAAGALAAFIAT
jgi:hypothetical protein